MTLRRGLTAQQSHVVTQEDLASNWGGEIPVLASPVLMGLLEQTCAMATDEKLPKGKITVGVGFDVLHLAPTPAQEAVTLVATLTEINGRQLQYFVEARDSKGVIFSGKHFRGIVDRERFLHKVKNRSAVDDSAPGNGSG